MNKTLDWIKEIREGNTTTLERDAHDILRILKREEFESQALSSLLEEIKRIENEDALLSLVQAMLEEEITPKHRKVKG